MSDTNQWFRIHSVIRYLFFRISSTTHGLLVHVTFVLLVWLRKKKKKHKSLQNVQQETVVHLLSLTCCNSLNILIHFCFRTNEVEATVVCLVMLWNKWKGVLNFLNVFFFWNIDVIHTEPLVVGFVSTKRFFFCF